MAPFRIAFSDWAHGTQPAVERIMRLLSVQRDVLRTSPAEADLLIYSDFGESHWGFPGLKVYVTGENMLPDFDQCDLAYSPLETPGDLRTVRFPYYAQVLPALGTLIRTDDYDAKPHLAREGFWVLRGQQPPRPGAKPVLPRLASSQSIGLGRTPFQ